MRKNNFNYIISIKGSNLSNLINYLTSKNLNLINLSKDSNEIKFELNYIDYGIFKGLTLDKYCIETLHKGGRYNVINLLINKLGLIIGLTLSIIFYIILSNRLLYINITGLTIVDRDDILHELSSIGVSRFATMPSSNEFIEDYLYSKFDFSLVSVIRRGNTLIISIKEEIAEKNQSDGIVADFDMVIKDIRVLSGISKYSSGSLVRAGEVIVEPYTVVNGITIPIEPKAEIVAYKFTSESYKYVIEESIPVRTGKKSIVEIKYIIGDKIIYSDKSDCEFTSYELEDNISDISQYFLPISINYITAYEINYETIIRDINEDKEEIILSLKDKCYLKINGEEVINESTSIIDYDGYKIINYYLTSQVTLIY